MNKKANKSLRLTRRATSGMDWLSMLLFELHKEKRLCWRSHG